MPLMTIIWGLLDAGFHPGAVGMTVLTIIVTLFFLVAGGTLRGDAGLASELFEKVLEEVKKHLFRYANQFIEGQGGDLVTYGGKTRALIVAFDYKGYGANRSGLNPLSCSPDAKRFASLCEACGAEISLMLDTGERCSKAFPTKRRVVDEMKRMAAVTGPQDTFVFFYAGHGTQSSGGDRDGDEDDGKDEELCLCTETGAYTPLKDDEIADIVLQSFTQTTSKILFVTDCCQSGTVCDLSREEFAGRPICHVAAVKDTQFAQDLGDGGAFTSSLLETIETLVEQESKEESIKTVFNLCWKTYSHRFRNQDFQFEQPEGLDVDTYSWPLMPPAGWKTTTLLDRR